MVDNLIRLFDSAETEFTSNGLGVLIDAKSCFVSEEKNGEYELELVYPVKGRYFSDILMRRIIVAKPNPFAEPQPFRIYSVTKPFNGLVTINAEHISYDLTGYPVDVFTATSCADAFAQIKEKSIIPCPFDFWTDKDVSKEYSINKPFNIRSLLGGVDGSILSAFGKGEYEFDRYSVKLWLNRGRDRGVVIRYGKNLTDLKQEENCSSVYTGVYPFWYSENVGTVSLPEKIVNVEGTFNYTKILTLDLSDRWTDEPKEEDLRVAAQNYIRNNNIGVPDISLDISFEQLAQSNEYKLYSLLEEVHLCDTVHVEFPDLGVSAKADCIKTIYNVLTNKYKKIELGSAKSSLVSTIANQEKTLDDSITKTFLEQSVDRATKLISGNAGGYVVMRNSNGGKKPNEILIMDTDDVLTAKKVWRWNNSGLGYSKTGYNGLYGLAMTIDGEINADYITTGILNAVSIRACDIKCGRIDEVLAHMAGLYAEEEGTYAFELSSDGEIKATKGIIGLCTIDENGRLIVPAAHISGLLVADQIDATDLRVHSANIDGQLTASQIDATDLTVSAVNVTGVLTFDQLPSNTAKTDDIPSDSYITTLTENTIKTTNVVATNLTVKAANIDGQLTASQIDATGITATNATIAGKITANDGKIGGWTITSSRIYKAHEYGNDGIGMCASDGSSRPSLVNSGTFSQVVFYAGAKDDNPYPDSSEDCYFGVLQDGSLYAQAAKISGTITAKAGSIADIVIGTETRYLSDDSIEVTGSVLKTPDQDANFSIFSYNYDGKTGSILTINTLRLLKPNFNSASATDFFCSSLNVGTTSILSNGLLYVDSVKAMHFNYATGGQVITATISMQPRTLTVTIKLSQALTINEKTYNLALRETDSQNWVYVKITVPLGYKTYTKQYQGPILGYDKALFSDNMTDTFTFREDSRNYIEFYKSFEPYISGTYDIGSTNYKWKTIYATNGTIQTSDRNEKKDIVLIDEQEQYDQLFDSLKPVTYRFKKNTYNRTHVGFIAQDIKESLDSLGINTADFAAYCDWTKEDGTIGYGLRYGEFVALNTYEIQKLKRRVAELEQLLQTKKGEIQNGEC